MQGTDDLVQEHEAVLVALRVLERVAAVTGEDHGAPADLDRLLDFLRGFVDVCHHGKEEEVLFPELERRGVPRAGGPIGVMLAEHEAGRGHVRAMADELARLRGGDAAAAATIAERAQAYSQLLRGHIEKENGVLFPLADRVLPADIAARVRTQYEAIERDRVGEGRHQAYHEMLHDLKERYGLV